MRKINCAQFPKGKEPKIPDVSRCPVKGCGLPNKCQVEEGKGTCWCFQYPKVEDPDLSDACMCEEHLKEKLKEEGMK